MPRRKGDRFNLGGITFYVRESNRKNTPNKSVIFELCFPNYPRKSKLFIAEFKYI